MLKDHSGAGWYLIEHSACQTLFRRHNEDIEELKPKATGFGQVNGGLFFPAILCVSASSVSRRWLIRPMEANILTEIIRTARSSNSGVLMPHKQREYQPAGRSTAKIFLIWSILTKSD
jgi:hypothetical protein